MTVQAPLIYAYPLNEWCVFYQDFSREAKFFLTSGQVRSLRAIGCRINEADILPSSAIKEIF